MQIHGQLVACRRESATGVETRRPRRARRRPNHTMESPHPDERPAKKRRFFAEDSSPTQTRSTAATPPAQSPPQAAPGPGRTSADATEERDDDAAALDGFDVGTLQAVVGELPHSTLQKLKDVSSSNVERGPPRRTWQSSTSRLTTPQQ